MHDTDNKAICFKDSVEPSPLKESFVPEALAENKRPFYQMQGSRKKNFYFSTATCDISEVPVFCWKGSI